MTNNEISTTLNSLYARIDTVKYVLIFALLYIPYLLHTVMGLSWIFVIGATVVCLAMAGIYFYKRFILKKAIAVQCDLEDLEIQVRLFKRWNTIGWCVAVPIILAFVLWSYWQVVNNTDNIYYGLGLLVGALIGGIAGVFQQKEMNKEMKLLYLAIAQQMR